MSSKLQSDGCYCKSVVAPSGERLRGEVSYGVFAVSKLCDTLPERFRGEFLTMGLVSGGAVWWTLTRWRKVWCVCSIKTTGRCTNLCLDCRWCTLATTTSSPFITRTTQRLSNTPTGRGLRQWCMMSAPSAAQPTRWTLVCECTPDTLEMCVKTEFCLDSDIKIRTESEPFQNLTSSVRAVFRRNRSSVCSSD